MSNDSVFRPTGTAHGNTDWERYLRYRPSYPKSLLDIILSHHSKSSSSHERALDVGSGVGIFVPLVAPHFTSVQVTDPGSGSIASARQYLSQYLKDNSLSTKVAYSVCKGEDIHTCAEPGTIDLVTCMTASHYADPDQLVEAAAKVLAPGGTLAVVTYLPFHFPTGSTQLNAAWQDVQTDINRRVRAISDSSMLNIVSRSGKNLNAGNGILDFIPLPDQLFDPLKTQRLRLNAPIGDSPAKCLLADDEPAASRVREGETNQLYFTGKDKEANGWSYQVEKQWIQDFSGTANGAAAIFDKVNFDDFYRLYDKEFPNGNSEIRYPVGIVLATRTDS